MLDINCTHRCRHQIDGKCTLNTLSSISTHFDEDSNIDCPYFEQSTSTLSTEDNRSYTQ